MPLLKQQCQRFFQSSKQKRWPAWRSVASLVTICFKVVMNQPGFTGMTVLVLERGKSQTGPDLHGACSIVYIERFALKCTIIARYRSEKSTNYLPTILAETQTPQKSHIILPNNHFLWNVFVVHTIPRI